MGPSDSTHISTPQYPDLPPQSHTSTGLTGSQPRSRPLSVCHHACCHLPPTALPQSRLARKQAVYFASTPARPAPLSRLSSLGATESCRQCRFRFPQKYQYQCRVVVSSCLIDFTGRGRAHLTTTHLPGLCLSAGNKRPAEISGLHRGARAGAVASCFFISVSCLL